MKNIHFFSIALFCILIISCSKQEEIVPVKQSTERPSNLQLPDFSHYNVSIPDVPAYTGPEPDPNVAEERGETVKVNPGENLQDIINAASSGDRIVLREGTHVAAETLVINRRLRLRGEDGAVLSLNGEVGMYVIDARKTSIEDLEITNAGGSVFGLVVESTKLFEFEDNVMTGFYISVLLDDSWKAEIKDNVIVGSNNDLLTGGFGITLLNGNRSEISGNEVSGNSFGIWLCDKDGKSKGNVAYDNGIGIILCKVPEGSFTGIFAGGTGGSENPCTRWKVEDNICHDNLWGYLVVDGAKDNKLDDNTGYNNAFVDLELAGETTMTFGFTTPTSDGNEVDAEGMNYIDCGEDNEVDDGVEVDLPCTL